MPMRRCYFLGLLDRGPYAQLMPTVLMSRISLLTPARPELFTIAATSLTVVPPVSHAMAPRRVACELPGGVVLRFLYSQKKEGQCWGHAFFFSI
jgi:hypothetical protein